MSLSRQDARKSHPHFTLGLICGRWKVPILLELQAGPRRTGQLVRALHGVSKNRLNESLRKFQRAGLIRRRDYPGAVPHVEYEATPLGRTLCPILEALIDWGATNRRRIEKALAKIE